WVNSGGSFGGNPLRQHVGLGKATRILKLEVYWPTSDQTQVFREIPLDQFIEITEGQGEYRSRTQTPCHFPSPALAAP
ncbi:MAG: ASPIC/UnbV domain-containing protein, partial [Planctomycetota bacterium]|nr:ASPIC/UnbV domain-containing protein [Planctomycetota bacterium]